MLLQDTIVTAMECLNLEDPVIKVIIVLKVRMFLLRMLTPARREITVPLVALILWLVNQEHIKTCLARFVCLLCSNCGTRYKSNHFNIASSIKILVDFLFYDFQWTCKTCPAGFYCDSTLQNDTFCSHGVQNPQPCPTGHYCQNGTKYATEFGCPNGTYR